MSCKSLCKVILRIRNRTTQQLYYIMHRRPSTQEEWDLLRNCQKFESQIVFQSLYLTRTWLTMQRNVWNDNVSWQTRRHNNSTKYQLLVSMTNTSKKKKWNLFENCHKYALNLFWKAYTWHVLDDPIFYGQRTNLHDPWLNGTKLVTNDYLFWFHTFITRVNSNNIVMGESLQSYADWHCFKTLILQEILRTQNQQQEYFCAYSVVIYVFQKAGCARNRLHFHTVQRMLR